MMMRGDAKVEGCNVPIFQLLQWKHAIRLEAKCLEEGWPKPFPRSVFAYAKGRLGLNTAKREVVVAKIQGFLDRYRPLQKSEPKR